MAAATPRILYRNLIHTAGAVLVPSDEATALPRTALLTHHPSDVWRSLTNTYPLVASVNDRVDFQRSAGPLAATIAAGSYSPASAYVAPLVAALEAADATPVWANETVYNGTTHKFTISSELGPGPITLFFSTGANKARSAAKDMGFTETDKSGNYTYTAEAASYHGRHWVDFDLGVAAPYRAVVMLGHNLSATGSARLDGDDATMVGVGLGATVDFTTPIDTDGDVTYFTQETRRYLRLVLDDVSNTAGYSEVGVLFVGDFLDLEGFEPEVADVTEELSELHYAIGGAHYTTRRDRRRTWELTLINITAATKTALEAFGDYVRVGGAFFFNFDSADPTNTRYVMLTEGLRFEAQRTNPVTWHARCQFREVLG